MEYRVRWEIDVDAESAREAALKAREAQMDPATLATVFSVTPFPPPPLPGVGWEEIDLQVST